MLSGFFFSSSHNLTYNAILFHLFQNGLLNWELLQTQQDSTAHCFIYY